MEPMLVPPVSCLFDGSHPVSSRILVKILRDRAANTFLSATSSLRLSHFEKRLKKFQDERGRNELNVEQERRAEEAEVRKNAMEWTKGDKSAGAGGNQSMRHGGSLLAGKQKQ